LPHQKSIPNFIDASNKNLNEIIFIIGQSLLYWKNKDLSNRGEDRKMLTMTQKKAVTRELQDRYQKSSKKEKIVMLSDNGSEFINDELLRYCEKEHITFTRSRPYRKNDPCYIEQKNWSVIRRTVGYGRHDTDKELCLLNKLYGYLRLYVNFFHR